MNTEKQLTVGINLTVTVELSREHGFLMKTSEVAKGFGVSESTLREHKINHSDEIIEGTHFVLRINKIKPFPEAQFYIPYKQTLWTKLGVFRLCCFVKSEQAKNFRDWAEDLVITASNQVRIEHSQLTQECLVDLLTDVAKIDDRELRFSIVNKLINTHHEKKD